MYELKEKTVQLCPKKKRKKSKPFTIEEDNRLKYLIEKQFSDPSQINSDEINWQSIIIQMPDRTKSECTNRWKRVLNPQLSHLPWTKEDDTKLLELYEKYGMKWNLIQKEMPHRNDMSLRFRFQLIKRNMEAGNNNLPTNFTEADFANLNNELLKPVPYHLEHYGANQTTCCSVSILDYKDRLFESSNGTHAEEFAINYVKDLFQNHHNELPDNPQCIFSISKSPCSSISGTTTNKEGCTEKIKNELSLPMFKDATFAFAPTKLYQPKNTPNAKTKSQESLNSLNQGNFSCFPTIR